MLTGIERDTHPRVTQALARNLGMDAIRQHVRGMRVPKIVESDSRQRGLGDRLRPVLRYPNRRDDRVSAASAKEHACLPLHLSGLRAVGNQLTANAVAAKKWWRPETAGAAPE